jgi:hypothetical protein
MESVLQGPLALEGQFMLITGISGPYIMRFDCQYIGKEAVKLNDTMPHYFENFNNHAQFIRANHNKNRWVEKECGFPGSASSRSGIEQSWGW